MAISTNDLLSMMKYHGEDGLERAYPQFHMIAHEEGVDAEDKAKAEKVMELLEEAYRITLSMSIADAPQVAYMRKQGEKARREKGRQNPFKGVVKGVK